MNLFNGALIFSALIALLTTLFLGRAILIRDTAQGWKTQIMAVLTAVVNFPIVFMLMLKITFAFIYWTPDREFNKERWMKSPSQRHEMSKEIIRTGMLIGKTHSEVFELLGEQYDGQSKTIPADKYSSVQYNLGFVPGPFNLDPDVLQIDFEDGVAVRVIQYES